MRKFYLYDDRGFYVGNVEIDEAEAAPTLSTVKPPPSRSKAGGVVWTGSEWTKAPTNEPEPYIPSTPPGMEDYAEAKDESETAEAV